jgi:hypothetical protein
MDPIKESMPGLAAFNPPAPAAASISGPKIFVLSPLPGNIYEVDCYYYAPAADATQGNFVALSTLPIIMAIPSPSSTVLILRPFKQPILRPPFNPLRQSLLRFSCRAMNFYQPPMLFTPAVPLLHLVKNAQSLLPLLLLCILFYLTLPRLQEVLILTHWWPLPGPPVQASSPALDLSLVSPLGALPRLSPPVALTLMVLMLHLASWGVWGVFVL